MKHRLAISICLAGTMVVALGAVAVQRAAAQPSPAGERPVGSDRALQPDQGPANPDAQPATDANAQPDASKGRTYLAGVSLPTDSDIDALLSQAQAYLKQHQHREALVVLQHIADHYAQNQALTQVGRGVWYRATLQVQRMIAQLPPEARTVYRLTADGKARGILKGPAEQCFDLYALRQVVNRYFISSEGDEATCQLAGLLIDRYDFLAARRLLRRLLEVYPQADRTVDVDRVYLRLALCEARVGNIEAARQALGRIRPGADGVTEAARRLRGELARDTDQQPDADRAAARITGLLGQSGLVHDQQGLWASLWSVRLPTGHDGVGRAAADRFGVSHLLELADRWREHGWIPTDRMVIDQGLGYVAEDRGISCIDLSNGQIRWTARAPESHQAQANRVVRRRGGGSSRLTWPATGREVFHFGDRLNGSMTKIGPMVYAIQGQVWPATGRPGRTVIIGGRRITPEPTNQLLAYDTRSRTLRWRVSLRRPPAEDAPYTGSRVLAPPIEVAGRLIVPFFEDNQFRLAALEPATGRVAWQRMLCTSARDFAPPWAPVGMVEIGGVVYLASGRGLLFAVDGTDGMIQWASQYPRYDLAAESGSSLTAGQWMSRADRWRENKLIVERDRLVLLPADGPGATVIDMATGRRISHHEQVRGTYCLGMWGGRLIVGDEQAIRCYDLADADRPLRWQADIIETATGRGLLDEAAIFVPADQQIIRIDAHTGKRQACVAAKLDSSLPLGNLCSDGHAMFSLGLGRLTSLVDAPLLLDQLAEADTAEQLLLHARLSHGLARHHQAADSARRALKLITDSNRRKRAEHLLFESLLAMADAQPGEADRWLDEAATLVHQYAQRAVRLDLARARAQASTGRTLQAIEAYGRLITDQRPILVPVPGDPDRQVQGAALAERAIGQLMNRQTSASVGRLIAERARVALEAAGEQASAELLWRLARQYPGTDAALAAGRRAALLAYEQGAFEQAELLADSMTRQPNDPRMRATGWMLKAVIYQSQNWHALAGRQGEALLEQYPTVELTFQNQATTGEQFARRMLNTLPEIPDQPAAGAMTSPPWQLLWTTNASGIRMVLPGERSDASPYLTEHGLFFSPGWHRLTRRRLVDGKAVGGSIPLPSGLFSALAGNQFAQQIRGGTDGHLLIARGTEQIGAIGIVTGQMLWSVPAPTAVNVSSSGYAVSSEPGKVTNRHYVRDGLLAEWVWLDDQMVQQVRAVRLTDGQLLWTRRIDNQQVDGVWITEGRVIIALDDLQRVLVCDGQTGRIRSDIQSEPADSAAFAAWNDRAVAMVRGRTLFSFDYSGKKRAQIDIPGARRMDRLSDSLLGVVETDQTMRLINLDNGQTLWRLDADKVGINGYDMALTPDGRRLYYLSQSGNRRMGLAIIDVQLGRVIRWVDLPRRMAIRIPARTLAEAGPIIPFFETDQRDRRRAHVRFFDVRTGQAVDDVSLPLPHGEKTLKHVAAPPVIRHGVMLLPTAEYVYAVGNPTGDFTPPAAEPQPDDSTAVPPGNPDGANRIGDGDTDQPARLIFREGQLRIEGQPPIRGRIILNGREFRIADGQLVPAEQAAPPDQPMAPPLPLPGGER